MSARAFRLAVTVARWWTRVYTSGLPPVARDRRREEIDSDLWELEHDVDRSREAGSAWRVLTRLIAGIPDDVGWRMEQNTFRRIAVRSTIAFAAIATALVMLASQALRPPTLPHVNPAPPPEILTLTNRTPPVPPPPPPRPGEDPDLWRRLLVPPKTPK